MPHGYTRNELIALGLSPVTVLPVARSRGKNLAPGRAPEPFDRLWICTYDPWNQITAVVDRVKTPGSTTSDIQVAPIDRLKRYAGKWFPHSMHQKKSHWTWPT